MVFTKNIFLYKLRIIQSNRFAYLLGVVMMLTFGCSQSNNHAPASQQAFYSNSFPSGDVQLLDGPFKHARDLNIEVLLDYDVDRLLAGYLKEAGLEPKAKSYPNWEGLDGHVGGHYLSALAMNYAATGNAECKKRMDYMISELKACQEANGKKYPDWGVGYVGGVPKSASVWSALKEGDFGPYRGAWVPWYNIHKIYAGLKDAWIYTGDEEAKSMFLAFCDWGIDLTSGLSEEQMQSMLDTEHGGMPETFADAYQMTGEEKYLVAAKRFSHHQLLDPMSEQEDRLDNLHANTQVPKAVGFQRIAELSDNQKFDRAGRFFWETVTQNRSLAFGGNSRREHFPSEAAGVDFILEEEGPESCNTYNMLKLTQGLFRMEPKGEFMDYIERATFNHILSTQHPMHGGYVYFTPARPRHYRVYSAPNEAMWCCVGSGMENHGKYNEFIYSHTGHALYLNLFIASELDWKNKGVKIRQETSFPTEEGTKLSIVEGTADFELLIRHPSWLREDGFEIKVNGQKTGVTVNDNAYVSLSRTWQKGDIVEISLPMKNFLEPMPYMEDYVAIMHGPILLGAKTGTNDLKGLVADDGRWSHIASGKKLPINEAPIIVEDNLDSLISELKPVPEKPLTFTFPDMKIMNRNEELVLEPFYQIHDSRYMIYWLALSSDGYQNYIDSLAALEAEKLALEMRTIDYVAPGEQQPEADHQMEEKGSQSGNAQDQFYRQARGNAYFSYLMSTNGERSLALHVRYWGAEWGNRKFEIYIDDQKLFSEDNTGRWNISDFQSVEYDIPNDMIEGKKEVRVKFQAVPGNTAGGVYFVRLIRQTPK